MHPRVLKEMAGEIANALVVIYQNSLNSGVVPAEWKTTKNDEESDKERKYRSWN